MMENATVTMPYKDFEVIKIKADSYDRLSKEMEARSEKLEKFIDNICHCIEKGAVAKEPQHKQYYLAEGLKLISEYYDINIVEEFGEVDEGVKPLK